MMKEFAGVVARVGSAWNDESGLDWCIIVIFEDYLYLHGLGIGKRKLDLFIAKAKEENAKFIWEFISSIYGTSRQKQ